MRFSHYSLRHWKIICSLTLKCTNINPSQSIITSLVFFSPLVIRYLSLFPLLLLVELSNYLTLVDAFPIFLTRPLSVIRDKLCVCISCTCHQPCLTLEIRGICPCLPEFETASMLLLLLLDSRTKNTWFFLLLLLLLQNKERETSEVDTHA